MLALNSSTVSSTTICRSAVLSAFQTLEDSQGRKDTETFRKTALARDDKAVQPEGPTKLYS